MPNLKWSILNRQQLGRYAEYYAKMEFSSYGFDVYTSEVDDHGVDFVAKPPNSHNFYEIQVKSVRDFGYVYITKEKMPLSSNRIVCYLHFIDGQLPDVYIIPSTAWLAPNAVLVDRKYDKEGQTSLPEWGINISKKNLALLDPYKSESCFTSLK